MSYFRISLICGGNLTFELHVRAELSQQNPWEVTAYCDHLHVHGSGYGFIPGIQVEDLVRQGEVIKEIYPFVFIH